MFVIKRPEVLPEFLRFVLIWGYDYYYSFIIIFTTLIFFNTTDFLHFYFL